MSTRQASQTRDEYDDDFDTTGKTGLNSRQAAGYKATLKRDNVSQAAKDHAQAMLEGEDVDAEGGYEPRQTQNQTFEAEDQHNNRVLGGYKATLKNPNVSEEAKDNAERVLEENNAI